MTVLKRSAGELVIQDSDLDLPSYRVRFVRDASGGQIVSVESKAPDLVGLDLQDILAVLSWLASAADIEQYMPGPLDDSPIVESSCARTWCGVCGAGHDCVLRVPAAEENSRG